MGNNISVQFHDSILCKLVSNYFTPVIPYSEILIQVTLRYYHVSTLGGHIAKVKLLKIKRNSIGKIWLMMFKSFLGSV